MYWKYAFYTNIDLTGALAVLFVILIWNLTVCKLIVHIFLIPLKMGVICLCNGLITHPFSASHLCLFRWNRSKKKTQISFSATHSTSSWEIPRPRGSDPCSKQVMGLPWGLQVMGLPRGLQVLGLPWGLLPVKHTQTTFSRKYQMPEPPQLTPFNAEDEIHPDDGALYL